MGCKKHHDQSCVCDAVEHILAEQEAIEESCTTSCYSNLLNPITSPGHATIPFILYTKKGELFKAFGNVGGLFNDDCFSTVFFRVENLKDCCATLSLLRPYDEEGETLSVSCPCDDNGENGFFGLEKSDFCIEIDLNCFCAIQCLSPALVNRAIDKHQKCRD
ncbi:CotY/CotZ family spore coat protein [Metabacillus herbersteinensis]|uniref:CotY/CotZ family spore coat protein n=1 Tax=Metabacillus herbersteinensis TaxID=283816 RepID=A0ABV6GDZ5_9BACI